MGKRIFGIIVLLIATAIGLFWPVVFGGGSSASGPVYDPVSISNYVGEFDVAADGKLTATETLNTVFPSGRHGIFRFWPTSTQADSHYRLTPTVTSITMDGAPVPVEYSWESGHRYYVAKIGDPNSYVSPGSHVYKISYTIDGTIFPPDKGTGTFVSSEGTATTKPGSVFYWNVIASGWKMPMAKATVKLNLPSPAETVQCTAGSDETANGQGPCAIAGTGTQNVILGATSIPAASGMTVRAAMPMPDPPQVTLPWPVAFDAVFGTNVGVTIAVFAVSALALAAGIFWAFSARETPPGLPVMYAPPQGMGPVQTVYIAKETVGEHALTSTLLYAADKNVVKLFGGGGDDWIVQGITTPEYWAPLDPVTRAVGDSLGLTTYGASLAADGSVSSGKTLKSAIAKMESTTKAWAQSEGYTVSAPMEKLGRFVWVLAGIAAVVGFIAWFGPTMFGLPGAAFVIGGLGLMKTGVGTRRTETGRRAWSEAGGFERLLSTPSAEDRFDFSADKNLFIAFIPYAAAFGVADKWAEKYRVTTGEEPPIPVWYPYPYAGGMGLYSSGGGGFESFESSLSSSIGAYEASQSSSSSGGGGGGFGGGGGGGGGGSW